MKSTEVKFLPLLSTISQYSQEALRFNGSHEGLRSHWLPYYSGSLLQGKDAYESAQREGVYRYNLGTHQTWELHGPLPRKSQVATSLTLTTGTNSTYQGRFNEWMEHIKSSNVEMTVML